MDMVSDVDGGLSGDSYTHGYGLLAPNPQFFDNDVVTRPPQSLVDFKRHLGDAATSLPSLHYSFTPECARIQFLCIPLADRHSLAFTSSPSTQKVQSAHALALLQCMDSRGRLVALPLCAPFAGKRNLRGLTLGTITPIEDDATTALISDQFCFVRLAPETVKQALQGGSLVPQEVTLLRHFPVPTVRKQLGSLGDWYTCGIVSRFSEPMRPSVFAISSECTAALKALGFTTSALDCRYSEREFRLRVVIEAPLSPPHGRARIPVTIVLALPERALSPHIQVSFITTHEFSTTGLNNGRQLTSVHLVDASMPPSPVAAKGHSSRKAYDAFHRALTTSLRFEWC
ncbi:hypothetical protein C2E23DRAFT_420666 [Lenzites betulinus]|nr:hypothetical protein C2E23DRAFT_420666 [Lenzites betulinus]